MFRNLLKKDKKTQGTLYVPKPDWITAMQQHDMVQQLSEKIPPKEITVNICNEEIHFMGWQLGKAEGEYPHQDSAYCTYEYYLILASITPLKDLTGYIKIQGEKNKYPYLILITIKNTKEPDSVYWQGYMLHHQNIQHKTQKMTTAGTYVGTLQPTVKFAMQKKDDYRVFIYDETTKKAIVGTYINEGRLEVESKNIWPTLTKEYGIAGIWE